MAVGIVSILVVAVVILLAIPVLAAVFGRASKRNPNHPDSEDSSKEDQGRRSGPRRG